MNTKSDKEEITMKEIRLFTSITALLTMLVAVGCSDDKGVAPIVVDPVSDAIAQNKDLTRRHIESVWNQGDLEELDEIVATNFVLHFGSQDIPGAVAYKQFITQYRAAFPDLNFVINEQVADEEQAATRYTATGTHLDTLFGIPPTNVQASATGIVFFRIANGRIVEAWGYNDQAGLLTQLGVLPPMLPMVFSWGNSIYPENAGADLGKNKVLVDRVADFFNSANPAIADEIFASNFVNHFPNFSTITNLDSLKQFAGAARIEWPDFHSTFDDLIAERDLVVGHWTVGGTHQGGAFGFPPTGKQTQWRGITIFRIANDKIVEAWWSQDLYGLLVQLGLAPAS